MSHSMNRWKGKVAVVTGASAGIGAAIAEKLVEQGMVVVGLARRADKMADIENRVSKKGGKFYPLKCDISQEQDILSAFKHITEKIGHVHVLVNNAGVAQKTNLMNGDTEKWKKVLDTNILGLCIATREALKDMTKNKIDGHIIHVNSILGHYVSAHLPLNIYPATKHAVTALSEALRLELNAEGRKIKISSLSPGVVKTEIFEASGFNSLEHAVGDSEAAALESEDIAWAVIYLLSTPPKVLVTELTIRPINETV